MGDQPVRLLMAEPQSKTGEPQVSARSNGSSNARATQPEIVLPPNAEVSDDAPTVISRTKPGSANKANALHETLGADLRGKSLAHFELIEPIGVGGMAAVIRARDKQLDRFVALKILPPEMSADSDSVQRFHQEARAAAKLDHENIARVFYCGEDKNLHFIAFEFVEGDNLRTILERRGKIPVPEAVRYMLQIAAGLEHAASRGVVHRDIKPSNIIITPAGRAKLVDMGLARSLHPHDDQGLTQSGVTLGTFDYISPEQALEPREADPRSDIYSLGCTFYHMLTGQPPVPEGTAAKKLHHHQHVAPVDPRQLNPDVPDEVVVILSRMMAKDPAERYQRPVHLVQHLLQVADKVGAGENVPEGVLFVDAPVLNRPRQRPLLLATLAVFLLGALLFVLSLTSPDVEPLPPPKIPDRAANGTSIAAGPAKEKTTPGQLPAERDKTEITIKSPADLARLRQVLEKNESSKVHVYVENDLDLSELPLLFKGTDFVMESRGSDKPARIICEYVPNGEDWLRTGLRIDGRNAIFKNLRFEVRLKANVTPTIQVAGIVVGATSQVTFDKCTFAQESPEEPLIPLYANAVTSKVPAASVLVENPDASAQVMPSVIFNECYFEKGQDAISVDGAAKVWFTNCAWGPHNAIVHLHGKSKLESQINVQHGSAFAVNGPVFRLDDQAACRLDVKQSIFSRPEALPIRDEPDFIRQTSSSRPLVRLTSKRNYFHNLNSYWAWPGESIRDVPAFQALVVKEGGKIGQGKEQSTFPPEAVNPWEYSNPLEQKDPVLMFQVKARLPEIRADRHGAVLGVQKCAWGPMPHLRELDEPPAVAKSTLKNFEKVVDPATNGLDPQVFKTLDLALAHADPGDVILLKHSQMEDVKPFRLEKAKPDITIKPYPDYRPVLTLAETSDRRAFMFYLQDGKLSLENLEILLRPAQFGFDFQTVATIVGNGQCSFKQCLFTLKEVDRVPLRVVTVEDPASAMKMGEKSLRSAPDIRFQDCFVRGEGDLVKVSVSRAFDLSVKNSSLALSGSLLSVQGAGKDPAADVAGNVHLENVSAFLGQSLINLQGARTGRGLAMTRVEAQGCLFVSLSGKALVYLDRLDVDDLHLTDYFAWVGSGHNAYSGFDRYLDQQRPLEMIPSQPIRKDEKTWKMYANEEESKHLQAKFALPASTDRPLSEATLDDFKALPDARVVQGFGSNLAPDVFPLAPKLPRTKPSAERTPQSSRRSLQADSPRGAPRDSPDPANDTGKAEG
jgi:serine/threonine protein kinase